MCGISGIEFLVIIVAAIIILGPEKLPDAMRAAGKLAREVRRIRGDLGDVTKEIRSQVNVADLQKQLVKELDIDRARSSMKDAESEIDALRARLNKDLNAPAAALLEDVTKSADDSATPDAAGTDTPGMDLLESIEGPAAPTTEGPTPSASASAAPPSDGMPQIRPAKGAFSQQDSLEAAAAPAGPPLRVRSTAKGAPSAPTTESAESTGPSAGLSTGPSAGLSTGPSAGLSTGPSAGLSIDDAPESAE